ncbi:MAG TPA: aquaporin, partial [Ktedonobacterales bacterium]|nr:aquaporin [Ktedonobacterales bacterium]
SPSGWAGLVIGLIVAGIIFVVGPVTGAALNPARAFGTVFVQALMGGKSFYGQYYVYVIGPVVGGALGGLVYDFLAQPKLAEERATLEAKTTERAAAASR